MFAIDEKLISNGAGLTPVMELMLCLRGCHLFGLFIMTLFKHIHICISHKQIFFLTRH